MNNLDKQYQNLLQEILDTGIKKEDRTGTGTISVFGRQIRHRMSEGFPLLTTKKMPFRLIVTELIWFLRGDTNIKFLVDNGCHIWDGDAYKNYYNKTKDLTFDDFEVKGNGVITITGFDMKSIDVYGTVSGSISNGYFRPFTQEEFINKIKTDTEFAKKWGNLGPVYGRQWRNWETDDTDAPRYEHWKKDIDQIKNLINDLKTNPDSRRLMVNAWNVGELDSMILPPCHYGFQVYTRKTTREEKITNPGKYRAISLMWNQRSVDTFLGLPFNIASYGLLLEIIAKEVNMVPDELIGTLGDTHLYLNHLDQAKEQIGREMTWEEQVHWVMKNTDVELENFYITEEVYKETTPKRTRQPYTLPKLAINDEFWNHEYQTIDGWINSMEIGDFQLDGYQSHPHIKATLSN
jgi:thymidylate synthase